MIIIRRRELLKATGSCYRLLQELMGFELMPYKISPKLSPDRCYLACSLVLPGDFHFDAKWTVVEAGLLVLRGISPWLRDHCSAVRCDNLAVCRNL